jgi:hypothetical protein
MMIFNSQGAFAAVKAGAPCPKKNITLISGSKLFTCIVKNKKLVWNSGKVIAAPKASPSPSPSATHQAPIAEDHKWYPWSFRYNTDGVLERRASQTNSWSSSPTRPGQVIDPVRVKAFAAIQSLAISSSVTNAKVNILFGPNVPQEAKEVYRKYFDISLRYFDSKIATGTAMDVIIGTELDDNFFKSSILTSLGNQAAADELFKRNEKFIHQFDGPEGKNSSGGGSVSAYPGLGKYVYTGFVCSCATSESILMYNVAHEVTHFYQFATTPTTPKQNFVGQWPNVTEGEIYFPNSLMEGSANTFGSALILSHVGWYSDQMDWHLGRYKRNNPTMNIGSEAEAVTLMKKTRSYLPVTGAMAELNYALGELVWEYYVAQYGVEAYFELHKNIQSLKNFENAMQKTIGKSEDDFYKEAAPYVMRAFNIVEP